ncbi:unnamed protein product, partial [Urochloa humidicola]
VTPHPTPARRSGGGGSPHSTRRGGGCPYLSAFSFSNCGAQQACSSATLLRMFCLRNYWSPASALVRGGATTGHPIKFNSVVVCGARGPRPRYPRVWKTRKKIGTISKSQKLVERIKGLSNVKEEVYGALDSFVAWDLEFPLIVVKKALKALEDEKEWKRIIQVIKWMFNKGQGKTMGSYYTLLNALIEDERIEEAEELFAMIFSRYMEGLPRTFFMRMISLYYSVGAYDKMFEVFADMN